MKQKTPLRKIPLGFALGKEEWQPEMENGIQSLLKYLGYRLSDESICDTPQRVVRAFIELTSGVFEDAQAVLNTAFSRETYDEIITVESIDFVSLCEHHLLPFFGQAHFAYLPDKRIVGLSKIPRMVEVLSHRPQVQERLTCQIVDTFQEVVRPQGCGVIVEAWHACASIRGVRKPNMRMRTTALRGIFREKPDVKAEFLASVRNGKR